MATRNVTISLPVELIGEAKHLAVDEGRSLSRFVSQAVEQRVRGARAYESATRRHLQVLERGFNLGTQGRVTRDRDSLHER